MVETSRMHRPARGKRWPGHLQMPKQIREVQEQEQQKRTVTQTDMQQRNSSMWALRGYGSTLDCLGSLQGLCRARPSPAADQTCELP